MQEYNLYFDIIILLYKYGYYNPLIFAKIRNKHQTKAKAERRAHLISICSTQREKTTVPMPLIHRLVWLERQMYLYITSPGLVRPGLVKECRPKGLFPFSKLVTYNKGLKIIELFEHHFSSSCILISSAIKSAFSLASSSTIPWIICTISSDVKSTSLSESKALSIFFRIVALLFAKSV